LEGVLADARQMPLPGGKVYFSIFMNNVFNPSANAGCAKIPSSSAV
jgi:hypothetical protein